MNEFNKLFESIMSEAKKLTPEQRIEALRRIVADGQYERIEGSIVDGTTAQTVLQVYDKLPSHLQLKLSSHPMTKMVDLTWKIINKSKGK